MGTLGLLGVRQGCQCVSFFPQLVPLITRNYLKQGFMEKTGPKVYPPLPGRLSRPLSQWAVGQNLGGGKMGNQGQRGGRKGK